MVDLFYTMLPFFAKVILFTIFTVYGGVLGAALFVRRYSARTEINEYLFGLAIALLCTLIALVAAIA